jgi:hypothetical protein
VTKLYQPDGSYCLPSQKLVVFYGHLKPSHIYLHRQFNQ